jgi:hypothetical protein
LACLPFYVSCCFLTKSSLQANLAYCSEKDRVTSERLVEPLMSLVKSYEGGRESHARAVVKSLFEEYLSVEELFSDDIQVTIYNCLEWFDRCSLSHQNVLNLCAFLLSILSLM